MTQTEFDAAWLDVTYEAHRRRHPEAPDWGYSFQYCPANRIDHATVGVIGLNPGGRQTRENRHWEFGDGLAYLDQPWGPNRTLNGLQRQIAALLSRLPVTPDEVFAAQLVPFRSPSWSALPGREAALAVFEPMWKQLATRSSVRLWFSLGYLPGKQLADWLGAEQVEALRTEWGETTARLARTPEGVVVVSLPHLSRYGVMTSDKCKLAMDRVVSRAVLLAEL